VAQQVTVTAKGLYTSPNQLGEVPDGALAQADNVVISKEGVIEPRHGASGIAALTTGHAARLAAYGGSLVMDSVSLGVVMTPARYRSSDGVTWTAWNDANGNISFPGDRTRHVTGDNGEAIFSGYDSVWAASALGSALIPAGGPAGTYLKLALAAGTGTAVANNKDVAYRAVWSAVRSDGTTREGAPSSRFTVSNASGSAKDITVSIGAPSNYGASGLKASLYRSAEVAVGATPSEEMQLVQERTVTLPYVASGETVSRVTNVVTITTATAHGFAVGDVIYASGLTSAPATGFFTLTGVTSTTMSFASVGANESGTNGAHRLIEAVCTDNVPEALMGATIYVAPSQGGILASKYQPPTAYHIELFRGSTFYGNVVEAAEQSLTLLSVGAPSGLQSGDTVTLGVISFTAGAAENYTTKTFLLTTGGTAAANVEATVASLVRVINANTTTAGVTPVAFQESDESPGRMVVRVAGSKSLAQGVQLAVSRATCWLETPGNVYAQARPSRLYWSSPGEAGAVPLTNYADVGGFGAELRRLVATRDALFVFKDDGIWRVTGTGGVWDVQPVDPTMSCPAPESLVAFENAVFGLLDSGVAKVTESGVEIISTPIYSSLEPLIAPAVKATTEAVAFGIAYHSAHKYILWLPAAAGDTVAKQAFVFDSWTNSWERWLPPTGVTGFYHGVVNPADDRLYMVDGTNVWQERKTSSSADFTDGTATAIPTVVKWSPKVGGNPGGRHHFREVALHFRSVQFTTASISFATDVSPAEETITLTGTDYGVDSARGPTVIRALVPLEKARGSQLLVKFSHANAGMTYELEGLSVVFNPGSTRVGR
jgi:hypothetical protein